MVKWIKRKIFALPGIAFLGGQKMRFLEWKRRNAPTFWWVVVALSLNLMFFMSHIRPGNSNFDCCDVVFNILGFLGFWGASALAVGLLTFWLFPRIAVTVTGYKHEDNLQLLCNGRVFWQKDGNTETGNKDKAKSQTEVHGTDGKQSQSDESAQNTVENLTEQISFQVWKRGQYQVYLLGPKNYSCKSCEENGPQFHQMANTYEHDVCHVSFVLEDAGT